jgi:hypothetical protein
MTALMFLLLTFLSGLGSTEMSASMVKANLKAFLPLELVLGPSPDEEINKEASRSSRAESLAEVRSSRPHKS